VNKIIGALWTKEKDGKQYFSGVIQDFRGDINIAVFPNNKKQAENQPDMNIVISFDRPIKDEPKEEKPSKNGRKKEKTPF
jgi:uncharacterized protein (DUF736 family)